MNCAYCDRVLICDACGAEVVPTSPEQYQALSTRSEPVSCPACEAPLICHWCKTPYDGTEDPQGSGGD